jgi:hypothetical protein
VDRRLPDHLRLQYRLADGRGVESRRSEFFKGAAVLPGGPEGLICTKRGTAGTYTLGRTATTHGDATVAISGAAMSTLRDQQDFKIGDWLTINSVTTQVLDVTADGLRLTMRDGIPAANNQSIAFDNPLFKEFGSIAA